MDLAKENNLHSIAFPAISTGVYGYPLADATEVAVGAVKDWMNRNNDYAIDITFCCFDKMHIAKLNGRICGAKRSHSVSEQPNCYQSV